MDYIYQRKNLFMASLCALCVFMMLISAVFNQGAQILRRPVNFVFMPVINAFSNMGNSIANRTHSVFNIASLEAESIRLREENEQLLLRLGLLESYLGYRGEWQELLGNAMLFDDLPLLETTIITRGHGMWYGTPIINAGRNDGVMVNMPVVTCSVFGRVITVNGNHSYVRTIVEDTSVIHVYSRRTDCEGFARGCYTLMLDGLIRLSFTSQNAEFAVGDTIYTSFLSGFFPAGLRVGEVIEIRQTEAGERYAILRPFANVHGARLVFVIMDLFEYILE